jgi:protease I
MSKIAFLIDQMFEDPEFRALHDQLRAAGHELDLVGLEAGREVIGRHGQERLTIEVSVGEVDDRDYDALVVLGRCTHTEAVRFAREIGAANKTVAAASHAAPLLIDAELADNRWVTCSPSVKADLADAGARWLDRDVVVDGNVITLQTPDEIQPFIDAILHQLETGVPTRPEPIVALPDEHPPSPSRLPSASR